ncbi:hypothetical protein VD0002_g4724 [Verticillium dahliae]|uniref:Uncharacterized protein n=1 Tax=Verticillium dahliae TaxID=27337 RepID=A0AA45ANJ1_VERDA|nr:Sterol uptake control protein 2 [Verticillium dahliae VDG2]PNH32811.1 hypothetical protein BJF96_g4105 [Verticillium dahliae]PNH57800.1 hypothetical protein VD0003_g46 [Verticillium dahliae]PNH63718.1 hypothetical protein VD0002_g4724 [Verticillium dahliae]
MSFLEQALSHPSFVLLGFLALATLVVAGFGIRTELCVRRLGGVRAPIIASNPVTALSVFVKLGRAQAKHKLPELFTSLCNSATPGKARCVEITFFGRHRFILTNEPEHIKTILTSKFVDFGKGPVFHEGWAPFLGDSIFTTDGKVWQDNRSLIRPMFVRDRVRDLAIFEHWTDKMVSKLPASGMTVDVMDLFYRMTLDVTTDFLLGTSVNSLDNHKHHFAEAFNEVQRMQMIYTILSPFRSLLPKGSYNEGIKTIEQFIMPFIEQALALPIEELDKISRSDKNFTFLHAIARATRDRKIIRDQLIAVLLAGRDTTAATLSWTIYELAHAPKVVAKLRSEILTTVGPSQTPSYENLKNMPCLTHCLNETLRLYPAVPFNVRTALQDSSLPGGPGQPDIIVLKGDAVTYSPYVMQRRHDLYPPVGPDFVDPQVYSPERWQKWTPRPWQYVPFNGGPRICVGQNFAMTEMAFCLVRLFQRYQRLEYRGDWEAQFLKADIVGAPGHGVPVAFFEGAEIKA